MVSGCIPRRYTIFLILGWIIGVNYCSHAFTSSFLHQSLVALGRHPTTRNVLEPLKWSTYQRRGFLHHQQSRRRRSRYCNIVFAKSQKKDEDSDNAPGMAEAFRQLDALNSLDDPEEYVPAPAKIHVVDVNVSLPSSSISPEQDFVVYKDMVQELESDQDASAYSEVLDELGGSALQTDDTYSQVMVELGGAAVVKQRPKELSETSDGHDDVVLISSSLEEASNEQILEDALKEALSEVHLNNPRISDMSILDDKEIMREIEAVFDAGNAKLLESLDEVRREQVRNCATLYWISSSIVPHIISIVSHPSSKQKFLLW
jgi:hypothetical protein